ncbi:MAG: VWA domain-containing protein [Pyrinomonadaceae bacterium]|nr:VWA domain-containing protein [Pyrinomonadaceae bacterium]
MKYCASLLLLLVMADAHANGQTPPDKRQPEKGDDVIKVTTNLVQVDAVVTDKEGRPVTNLTAADFELVENAQLRAITEFSYISLRPEDTGREPNSIARKGETTANRSGPPRTLHAIRRETVRRAIAIVVDDVGLSAESTARLRSALERFVQERTQSTDLIAVIRASGGPGAMQQFTSNRAQVLATIKGLTWYQMGRGRMSATESWNPLDNNEDGIELKGYSANRPADLSGKEFFGGSLGALGFVIQGLSSFPGRKSLVLVSDNLPVTSREALAAGVTRALDKLIEQANQHSIVISTIDARGMQKPGPTADDGQHNLAANQINTRTRERRLKFNVQSDGLNYLAAQTGGIFVHSNNDLTDALRRVVDGELGYYLLAYRPDDLDDETARARTFKVRLRVNRPGLEVRTRNAFHRTKLTREVDGPPKGKDDLLREALVSPFVTEGVRLKMTGLFTGGSQVKILLHVDARDLAFVKSADDIYNGSLDIVAVAFDDNGKPVRQVARTQTLRVPSAAYEHLLRDGVVYSMTVPIQSPGGYQLRLALRDGTSGRLGSDSQFVEVPDAKKTRLTVSGFAVQRIEPEVGLQHAPEMQRTSVEGPGGDGARRGLAVRRFDAGDLLTYSYLIYGARRNSRTDPPSLLTQIRLFCGDTEVFTGRVSSVDVSQESSSGGIVAQGNLRLGTGLTAGEYFIQVIVTDKLAAVGKQVSDQWLDFEIVK